MTSASKDLNCPLKYEADSRIQFVCMHDKTLELVHIDEKYNGEV